MPMQMGFRWYGEGNDKISLSDIKQIPGVTSIVWALHNKMPGEVWEVEEIAEVQKQLEPYGFNMDVVESVNVHDDIKVGLPTRDGYIANYIDDNIPFEALFFDRTQAPKVSYYTMNFVISDVYVGEKTAMVAVKDYPVTVYSGDIDSRNGQKLFSFTYHGGASYGQAAELGLEPEEGVFDKNYLPEVELFANGVSLGKKASAEHFFYFDVPNNGETTLVAVAGEYKDESKIRKVEVFNEEYRLREKSAILNWFDITEVEGYFSLNDKLSDIVETEQGRMLFSVLLQKMMQGLGNSNATAGMEVGEGMMQMMGGFTVIRLTSLMGAANVKLTKEDLLALNAQLNKIPKPTKRIVI